MRQFFLLNLIWPSPAKWECSDDLELLPIEDTKVRNRLEQRAIKEELSSKDIIKIVQKIGQPSRVKPSSNAVPLKFSTELKLHTFAKSMLRMSNEGYAVRIMGAY